MKITALVITSMIVAASCGKTKKSDDAPATNNNSQGEQNPAPAPATPPGQAPAPAPTESIDSGIIGTWTKSENQQGFQVDLMFTFKSVGTGQQIIKLNNESIVDVEGNASTDKTVSPNRLTFKVTKVTVDSSDEPMNVGDTMKCLYQLDSATALKLTCSEKNQEFPAAFGADDIVLQKN